MPDNAPIYDKEGLNLFDPNDSSGKKSKYITLLQEKALNSLMPKGPGNALDVGCGYGRLTYVLKKNGWHAMGVDPDPSLIDYASKHYLREKIGFRVGSLPDLPVEPESTDLIMLHNVLRPLHLMGSLHLFEGIGRFMKPGSTLVIVDNVWEQKSTHLDHKKIVSLGQKEGLELESAIPIRAGRWWLIYLIRYGLIPESWFGSISDYEILKRSKASLKPRYTYLNVLYTFKKPKEVMN